MKFGKTVFALSFIALTSVSSFALQKAQAQDKVTVINPSSNWAVTKIDQGQAEPYCTLVRQYEGGSIVTLGQNINEEYSIALDFQKPTFDPEESYSITLQPGPGQLRAYEMMPASPGAMVVRLGWDDSFLSALADSQMLKAEIDGAEYNFAFPDFSRGEEDLSACMDALKNPEAPVVADAADAQPEPIQPKQDFSAKKAEVKPTPTVEVDVPKAQPPKAIAKAEPKVVAPKIEPKIEPKVDTAQLDKMAGELTAAKSEAARLNQDLIKEKQKYELLQQAISRDEGAQAKAQEQVAMLQTEKKALEEKLATATAQHADNAAQQQALEKMQQEVASLTEQNKSLSTALQQKQAGVSQDVEAKDAELTKLNAELVALSEKVKAAEAETATLKASAEASKTAMNAAASKGGDAEKLRADLASALNEKNTLLAELSNVKAQLAANDDAAPAANNAEIDLLKSDLIIAAEEKDSLLKELSDAKTSLAMKEKEVADLIQKQQEVDGDKTAALEARVVELEAENKKYFEDAKLARSEVDQAKVELANNSFKKVEKLEDKLEAAMSDNISLTKQVEELSRMQDQVATGLADSDWNLEKATRRYNEAEKEIRRLGALMEQQRGNCRAEAKELEQMLFDPAVADQKQRSELARLQEELAETRRELRRAGVAPSSSVYERVAVREDQGQALSPMPSVPAEPVQRVSQAPKVAPTVAPAPAPKAEPKPVAVSKASLGQADIQSILQGSGIGASSVSSAGNNAYRWSTQNMSGYAQVASKAQAGDVVQYAQNYINQQRARCKGDFASVPGSSERGKATYELACVGGNTSTSSSIVFFEREGSVALISHQTSADDMDVAMDARDKVASQIR
ncbi:MAG: hypothetical protein HRT94_00755 [Alphaproteobacteria bacterium]|nr:hypothetical protein [Alphaproteobacteria bacterium]